MATYLLCQSAREAAAFAPLNVRRACAKLGFDVRAETAEVARAGFEAFLRALPDAKLYLYRIVRTEEAITLSLHQEQPLAPVGTPAGLAGPILAWLDRRVVAGSSWTTPNPPGELDHRSFSASQLLGSAVAWDAPLAQEAGLSRLVALPDQMDGEFALLPYFADAQAVAEIAVDKVEGRDEAALYHFGYDPGLGELTGVVSALLAEPHDATLLVDEATGFLRVPPDSEKVHAALGRIRDRAASLFWTTPQLLGLTGQARGDTPEAIRAHRIRWLTWRAMTGLTTLLDPVATTLAMPEKPKNEDEEERKEPREGPVLAALNAIVETARFRVGETSFDLRANGITKPIRAVLLAGLAVGDEADVAQRRRYAALIRDLFDLGGGGDDRLRLLPILLDIYAEHSSGQVPEEHYEHRLAKRFTTSGAELERDLAELDRELDGELDRGLGELVQRMESEQGIEAVLLELMTKFVLGEVLVRALTEANPGVPEQGIAKAAAEIGKAFESRVASDFNGLDASRFAQGSAFESLIRPAGTEWGWTEIAQVLDRARWFSARLGLIDPSPELDPLARGLATVALNFLDEEEKAALTQRLDAAFLAARADMFAGLDDNGRFIPDTVPPPLPVRIAVDRDTEDVDIFAVRFSGVALLVKRLRLGAGAEPPWAYANLAKLTVDEQVRPEVAVHPLLPAAVDGRTTLHLEYRGVPLAETGFATPVPKTEAGEEERPVAFFRHRAPKLDELGAKARLPALAYGFDYAIASHAVSRSGALPRGMGEQQTPWLPRDSAPDPPAEQGGKTFVSLHECRRKTAIGTVTITSAKESFANRMAGVQPLARDYPRFGFRASASGSSTADLWRGADGAGAIALPLEDGAAASLAIDDVCAFGSGSLWISVMGDPRAGPASAPWGSWSLDVAGPLAHGTISIGVDRSGDNWRFELQVEHAPGLTIQAPATFEVGAEATGGEEAFWLRLVLDAPAAPLSFSCSDPRPQMRGQHAAGRQGADGLLLLAPPDEGRWRDDMPSRAALDVAFPRMGYADFDRWLSNEALFAQGAAGQAAKLTALRHHLLARRLAGRPEEQIWSRLPDLAVDRLLVELTPLDSLRTPAEVQAQVSADLSLIVPIPALGVKLPVESEIPRLVDNQLLVDNKDDHSASLEVRPGASLALTRDGSDRKWLATVPPGMVARLSVRPMVSADLFADSANRKAAFDPRLLELSAGRLGDHFLFDGDSLTIEVMQDFQRAGPDAGRGWPELGQTMVTIIPAGRQRAYQLAVQALRLDDKTAAWRQLGSIDVRTQRWRFMGRPIHAWFEPRHARVVEAGAIDDPALWLRPDDSGLNAFEREAFLGRDGQDADIASVVLKPLPLSKAGDGASTVLQWVPWDNPSATLFRHRLQVRSRYGGAMRSAADGEAPLQPAEGEEGLGQWIRVAMLADRTRLQLTRPQLRALLPLTTAREGTGAPPILAMLEEPPFAYGGLADRIAAEIKTGFGYDLPEDNLEIADARKEFGPDPRLTYKPVGPADAVAALLVPDGPIGLTFDSPSAPAPAFANSAFILDPRFAVGAARNRNPDIEEYFLSVSMRRYLDPLWTVGEAVAADPASLDPAQSWWIDWASEPGDDDAFLCEVARPPETAEAGQGGEGEEAVEGAEGDAADAAEAETIRLCKIVREEGLWRLRVNNLILLPTASPIVNEGVWPMVAEADSVQHSSIALLHQPLEDGRAALSVFLVKGMAAVSEPDAPARQDLDLPLMLASFEWTLSKPGEMVRATKLCAKGASAAFPVNASPATLMNWTRTGRNFDVVAAVGPSEAAPTTVRTSVAKLTIAGETPSQRGTFLTDRKEPVWPRPPLSLESPPLYVHRHLALIVTREAPGAGRSLEVYRATYLLTGMELPALAADSAKWRARVMELEVPALPLAAGSLLPEFGQAIFDLTAIRKSGGRFSGLLFCVRPVGPARRVEAGWSMRLEIASHPPLAIGPVETATLRIGLASPAPAFDAALIFLILAASDQGTIVTGIMIGKAGTEHSLRCDFPSGRPNYEKLMADEALAFRGLAIGSGEGERWVDISMLSLAGEPPPLGAGGIPFSFDWLFTGSDIPAAEAVTPAKLKQMVEAQARVVAVSAPIPIERRGP